MKRAISRTVLRLWPSVTALVCIVLTVTGVAHSQRLSVVEDAGNSGYDILQLSLTPLHQYALDTSEDTGSYEIDLSASLRIRSGRGSAEGRGGIVFWSRVRNNLGNLQPASEMAARVGLLWPTNDVVVTDTSARVASN